IATVVFTAEGYGFSRFPIQPVRKHAVIMVGLGEEFHHGQQSVDHGVARNPAPFSGYDHRHDAKARPTRCHDFATVIKCDITSFTSHKAGRMSKIPEISKSLSLNQFEELFVT